MKTVYLAGPISGCSYGECTDWRHGVAQSLGEVGIKGLSPMRGKEYLGHLQSISSDGHEYAHLGVLALPRGVMTRDRFDATRCDVLLVNLLGAKKVSIGTVKEIAWADACRTPIVCAMEDEAPVHIDATDRAWLAALVDGEGCASIVRRERNHSPCFEFRIQVTMTDRTMIETAHKRAGGLGTITGPYSRNNPRWKPAWRWSVNNQQAATLAAMLYPHLILKARSAAIGCAIEEMNSSFRPEGHKNHKGFRRRPPELVRAQQALFDAWKSGAAVDVEAPRSLGNVHEHMMISEAIGFRVPTLDEAVHIVKSILL